MTWGGPKYCNWLNYLFLISAHYFIFVKGVIGWPSVPQNFILERIVGKSGFREKKKKNGF